MDEDTDLLDIASEVGNALSDLFDSRPTAPYGPRADFDETVVAGLYGPAPDAQVAIEPENEEAVNVSALYGPAPDELDGIPADLYGPAPVFEPEADYPNRLYDLGIDDEMNHRPSSIKDLWRVWREMRRE